MTVSSTDTDMDVNETVTPETGADDSATSSDAGAEGVGPKSMLDAVNEALEQGSGDAPTPSQQDQEAGAADQEETGDGDPSEEELKNYSQGANDRIRELVNRRKEAEGQLTETRQELDAVKPKADRMDTIEGFMRENSIQPQDLSNALQIAALIQTGQHARALEVIQPIYERLTQGGGGQLPEDLQREVDLGYITADRARELNTMRVRNQQDAEAQQRDRQRADQNRQRQQFTDTVTMMAKTGDAWDAEQRNDPDWKTKQAKVHQLVELELRRLAATPDKLPRNEQEVRVILDNALKTVNQELASLQPPPRDIRQPAGRPAAPAAKTKPKTFMEAIDQAIADARS